MSRISIMLAVGGVLLSGCSTYSFAPPQVSLTHRSAARAPSQECLVPAADNGAALREDVDGAIALIDNFIDSYRCTMALAADGRQAWQLPGFIALAGSATAMALGGGTDWGIAGGAASQMFTAGNSYYDSQEQALILRDALEALSCIQMEAVGMSAFARMPRVTQAVSEERVNEAEADVRAAEIDARVAALAVTQGERQMTAALNAAEHANAQFQAAEAGDRSAILATQATTQANLTATRSALAEAQDEVHRVNGVLANAQGRLAQARAQAAVSEIQIAPERQYFRMISSALLGVEVAAAQRLSQRGTYDAEGVRARIEDLEEEETENSTAANAAPAPSVDGAGLVGMTAAQVALQQVIWVQIQLNVLQPQLQQCILRAQV